MVTIQSGEGAWGYGFGVLVFGIASGYLWFDEMTVQGNLREKQKGTDIARSNQGHGQIMFPTPPNQLPAPGQVPPPTGPSSPIQRGN